MDLTLEMLSNYCEPMIFMICLCVGYIVKKWIKDVDNKYIPTLCAVVGLTIAVIMNFGNFSVMVIVKGLVSGLSAVGFHQVFKQMIERNGEK